MDGIAIGAAAEAVVNLLRRAHLERGRGLAVERAARLVFHAGLFQRHPGIDHGDDIHRRQQRGGIDSRLIGLTGHLRQQLPILCQRERTGRLDVSPQGLAFQRVLARHHAQSLHGRQMVHHRLVFQTQMVGYLRHRHTR